MSFEKIKKTGISGNCLKNIAVLTMIIDHIAASLMMVIINTNGEQGKAFLCAFYIFRGLGRISFVLFSFLLVEGFVHTKNYFRYLFSVLLTAVVSELLFDMLFYDKVIHIDDQSALFTLVIGLIAMKILSVARLRFTGNARMAMYGLIIFTFFILAQGLKADYGGYGVLCICFMYLFREERTLSILWGCAPLILFDTFEIVGLISLLPISLYNGRRKNDNEVAIPKYIYYLIYPVHLLVLYWIIRILGY